MIKIIIGNVRNKRDETIPRSLIVIFLPGARKYSTTSADAQSASIKNITVFKYISREAFEWRILNKYEEKLFIKCIATVYFKDPVLIYTTPMMIPETKAYGNTEKE